MTLKKIICVLLTMLLISSVIPVAANGNITVKIDGEQIAFDVQPQLINNRTMVPLRAIFEALGASVNWDNNTQTVTAVRQGAIISLTINDTKIYVNGEAKTLDSPACLVEGRTLVPVRAISEAFGATVDWDGATSTVLVSTSNENDTSYRTAIKSKNDFIKYVKEYGTKKDSFYYVSAVDSYKDNVFLYYMLESDSILIGYNATYGNGVLDLVYVLKDDDTVSSYSGTYTITQDNKKLVYTFDGSYKAMEINKFFTPKLSNFKVEYEGVNMTGYNPQNDKDGKEFIKTLITDSFMRSIVSAEDNFNVFHAFFGFRTLYMTVNPNPTAQEEKVEEDTALTYEVEYNALISWANTKKQEISVEAQEVYDEAYNQAVDAEIKRYFPNYGNSSSDSFAAVNMLRQLEALMPAIEKSAKQTAELASKAYEADALEALAAFLQDEIAKLKQKYNIR